MLFFVISFILLSTRVCVEYILTMQGLDNPCMIVTLPQRCHRCNNVVSHSSWGVALDPSLCRLEKKRVFSTQDYCVEEKGVFMLYLSIMGYISGVGHLFYIIRPSQYRKPVTAFSLPPPRPGTAWCRQFFVEGYLELV